MSAQVDLSEVKKIAALARLKLEGDELAALTNDFNSILNFVSQINEIDTSSIDRQNLNHEHANVIRKDEIKPSLEIDKIKKSAPRFEAGFFVVPKVIESE